MISVESSESRPSRYAVASRAWTRRPRPRAGSYEEDGGGAGHEAGMNAARQRKVAVPLAWVTRGQPRLLGIIRVASSAPLTGVTARLPKLIVRVRFSSPALIVKAQARGESRAWALIVPGRLLISR